MGYFVPTLLAFVLNSCGIYIFHDASKAGCEPLVSSLIFLLGLFLLLWDMKLFPSSLRNLWKCGTLTLHFFVVAFLMEHIMNDFWFPLEASLLALLPKIADFEATVLRQFGWNSPGILQFLKIEAAHIIASYSLSLFFFISVLHATRIVDLRLLRCGKDVFFADVIRRVKRTFRKLYKYITRKRNTVKFQSCPPMDDCDDGEGEGRNKRSRRRSSHY